jgi:hypothetical protein
MENSASTNGDLDEVAKQLEMLAQNIKRKNGEVLELQKEMRRWESNWRKHRIN